MKPDHHSIAMSRKRFSRRTLLAMAAGAIASRAMALPAQKDRTVTAGPPAPSGLLVDLLGVAPSVRMVNPAPHFTWIVGSDTTNDLQTAFQIVVSAVKPGGTSVLWDSGKVQSAASVAVPYSGPTLASDSTYLFRVRTWDAQGRASTLSEPLEFRTGHLNTASEHGATDNDEGRHTVVRYPLQIITDHPATVRSLASGHGFADFAKDAFASLTLVLATPPAAQTTVTVRLGEALDSATGLVNRNPGGSIRYLSQDIGLQPNQKRYQIPLTNADSRMMPPEIGAVMPFRYVEVENLPEPLTDATLERGKSQYPFDDDAGTFECSDPKINAIWDICHYSMKALTFCGQYVDGDRERLPYEADSYIHMLGHYACDREFTLARYSQEHLITHPTWPTEWPMHSVMMSWADYMYTGDNRSLVEFYDDIKAKTLIALARPDGLISTVEPKPAPSTLAAIYEKSLRDIVDWPQHERDSYDMRPVNTVVNCFHAHACRLMAQIASVLGNTADAALFEKRANDVALAINDKLFDTARGLYVDGEGSAHASLHANMMPAAFGLIPSQRKGTVASFLQGKAMDCSVYGAQYFMEALFELGLDRHALDLATADGDRSWWHMVNDVGTTITLEAWDNKYKPNQDWNHAWGAAPANLLPRKLMGIEPTSPGFATLRVKPRPGGLSWASIKLPTIRGAVHASFKETADLFVLDIETPANTRADIHLPLLSHNQPPKAVVDGNPQSAAIADGFAVISNVGSGKHHIELT